MSEWAALAAELDRWHAAGCTATLWWRDDDAVAAPPALARLLDLARRHDVPLALAVIPAALDRSLVDALDDASLCTALQHGYAHRNHAGPSERACELGSARDPVAVASELAHGRRVLREALGARFVEVLVPPWNRIDAGFVPRLPALGYVGLSTFGPRRARHPAPGLTQCNTHVDPIAWRAGRGFAGEAKCLHALTAHLADRRERRVDAEEPTGLLTHHLAFDEDAWRFAAALLACTRAHPATRWLSARDAFAAATCGRSA